MTLDLKDIDLQTGIFQIVLQIKQVRNNKLGSDRALKTRQNMTWGFKNWGTCSLVYREYDCTIRAYEK